MDLLPTFLRTNVVTLYSIELDVTLGEGKRTAANIWPIRMHICIKVQSYSVTEPRRRTGIETHTNPRFVFHEVDYSC